MSDAPSPDAASAQERQGWTPMMVAATTFAVAEILWVIATLLSARFGEGVFTFMLSVTVGLTWFSVLRLALRRGLGCTELQLTPIASTVLLASWLAARDVVGDVRALLQLAAAVTYVVVLVVRRRPASAPPLD
ncbi:hypothetical protein [Nocardioides acrostichi]|uniref:Uncharacterized protein n=1 Tax=Nocardioides acrostichi TaxID=2784339 RepID=A0A930YCH3_9ACTN|nr:hypothetical protein [Nocardioides acrostichi]MBF4161469.1 hypothetical protein [Nocardioides acrostichi]